MYVYFTLPGIACFRASGKVAATIKGDHRFPYHNLLDCARFCTTIEIPSSNCELLVPRKSY